MLAARRRQRAIEYVPIRLPRSFHEIRTEVGSIIIISAAGGAIHLHACAGSVASTGMSFAGLAPLYVLTSRHGRLDLSDACRLYQVNCDAPISTYLERTADGPRAR